MNEKEQAEETAIDKIYKMEKDIEYLKQYVQLIDTNLKLLNNKVSKVLEGIEAINSKPATQSPSKVTATPGKPPPPQDQDRRESDKLVLGKIKTFGYIVNKSKQPIAEVEVQVYDEKNEVVKKRKTDNNGYWEVRLPPGKYGVEYRQDGYRPINRTILLDKTLNSFEVK